MSYPLNPWQQVAPSLESSLQGRRVLLVNSIRSDTPSGGNTSTQCMLARWKAICSLQELSLNPTRGGFYSLSFALWTLPAALFVMFARLTGQVWLEFLLRASPYLYLRCLWARWRIQPEVVIFNHHASFLYLTAFPNCQHVLVWHDVPSLKRDDGRNIALGARRCAALERMALKHAQFNITFSFDDNKGLRRLHGSRSSIVPVIDHHPRPRQQSPAPGHWLLIGNWTRIENREGAQALLLACAELSEQVLEEPLATAAFRIAGYHSETFKAELLENYPSLLNLEILTTPSYKDIGDFNEIALLAPLLRGAGIKLKTIEAWAAGIPVIGTAQAFTGLPRNIWNQAGIRVSSISEMAQICMTSKGYKKISAEIAVLNGETAYIAYKDAIMNASISF